MRGTVHRLEGSSIDVNARSLHCGGVKPARFSYARPSTVAEATDILNRYPDEAKVLAGGQSLGPLLNFRLATPSVLVDINHVAGLDEVRCEQGRIVIGAAARQRDVERSADVAAGCPLIVEALHHVGHRAIRNRGTVVGSLSHADPAAEMPAVAVALDAEIEVTSADGTRTISARDFFRGYFTTALEPTELAVAVTFPEPPPETRVAWTEFAPRDGDFAVAGVAVVLRFDAEAAVIDARLVCSGVADVPVRLAEAESLLLGHRVTAAALGAVAAAAAAEVNPTSDLVGSTTYRKDLVAVLTRRGIQRALAEAA